MGAIIVLAAVITVAGFAWTGIQLRTRAPGPERDALLNSFWFLGGSGTLLLSLAMGLDPIRLPLSVRLATLGVSGVLTTVGSVNARRLRAARRQHLLAAQQEAGTVVDRVAAMEALSALDRGPRTRIQVMAFGGKIMMAAICGRVASETRSPSAAMLFGAIALGNVIWAGVDLLGLAERRRVRAELNEKVEALLSAPNQGED